MTHPYSTAGYNRLLRLQRRIHDHAMQTAQDHDLEHDAPDHPLWLSDYNRLALAPMRKGLHVEFFGEVCSDPLEWTLECLGEQDVANVVSSLSFSGPDEGANGTRDWEFTTLLESRATFPLLRSLYVKPTEPADHNISLIQHPAHTMRENGEIARLVARMPYLSELVVPNAPDADFFQAPLAHLTLLQIGPGYDTQRFIDNLAASRNLPALKTLDFAESRELQGRWADQREPGAVTSAQSYAKFLASPASASLRVLRLRNTCLSLAELQSFQTARPDLQFMVIQAAGGGYVSHFAKNVFPWRHLVQPDPGMR
jgi:hypothetical protein